jgi:glycosyltransferase involved in cell wall biosynthesis
MHLSVPLFYNRVEPAAKIAASRGAEFSGSEPSPDGLRILHILRAPLGGLFRHVCDLVEEQTRMGHRTGIICDSQGGEQTEAALRRLSACCRLGIHRVRMSRQLGLGDVVALAKIHRHVRPIAPDVIHGHGAKGGAYARLLPRVTGRVVLYTPHGGTLHYNWRNPTGALFLGLEHLLMARTDGIIFESQYGQRVYAVKVGLARCPTRVVFNGLSQSDFAPLEAAKPIYDAVFVGELRTLKGISTLIEAGSAIARDREFRLAIAGTGPEEKKFRAEVAAHGLDRQVDFLGHRAARDVFAMGRTIVVPSLAESFPYIVLEGMAAGRPVIATNVGGIPEIFGPHANALVPAGDAKALARAIRDTLDQPKLATALQERAKKLFSAARMAHDVTRFYGDLSQARAAKPSSLGPVKVSETTAV